MSNYFKKKKEQEKQIAEKRIKELFRQAEIVFKKHPARAHAYVALARKIATRTRTRLPLEVKRRFCKYCGKYLQMGANARIRLNKGKKTYFCMECQHHFRVPYK
jgi:ribonuclease P protein subunit RPR2